ncbi:MAG: phosphoethanolamine--lipid A transferase EptA [Flavobacteriaceae bacterium]|nr:phosphoethanolamine--lipid A transferase EptA [Flavobacteriaceae bacterium]
MFKKKLDKFALILGLINTILYHYPFYKFVCNHTDIGSLNGVLLLTSLTIVAIFLNALVFYIGLYALRNLGKYILVLFFNINAVAVYFINTYGVIIDRTMIGNILNTNYEESSAFFSFTLILYVVLLGILPSIFVLKTQIIRTKFKKFLMQSTVVFVFLGLLAYANAPNWLWIDKNAKPLGALAMPWSYAVNTVRYFHHKNKENKKQILLPDAKIKNDEKSVMVLVIGESARSQNFSLYGYEKNTNPLLSQLNNVVHYKAESCATYTTAGVKCILEHKDTGDLYENLPNYLYRNGVAVYWRTSNWGEPKVSIESYQERQDLRKICEQDCEYDGVLLAKLKEQILASNKHKILIVLHTSTSHGPSYYKKYPPRFEVFKPVCKSVELAKCSQEELINAYDNTIVYTDYLLASIIKELASLTEYKTAMLYVSDHGESLGENNLYMHGIPKSLAPKEQYEIPFIIWTSDTSKKLKSKEMLSQHYVFHTILDFLAIDSPIYNEELSLFED